MFGRSASAKLLLLALLAVPLTAHARKTTFDSGSPFGLGFQAGVSQNPDSDLVLAQSNSTGFSHFFAFEPFLDFGNFVVRFTAQLHSFPVVSGSGTDGTGAFGETSDASAFLYGVHLLLNPYISESNTSRAFIKLGLSQAVASGKNQRTYQTGTVYTEKFDGHTRELLLGAGFEFIFTQNYSLQVEAGARQLEFDHLSYKNGGTDLKGAQKGSGDPLLTSSGANRKLNYSGAYFSVGLNLNF